MQHQMYSFLHGILPWQILMYEDAAVSPYLPYYLYCELPAILTLTAMTLWHEREISAVVTCSADALCSECCLKSGLPEVVIRPRDPVRGQHRSITYNPAHTVHETSMVVKSIAPKDAPKSSNTRSHRTLEGSEEWTQSH